MIKRNLQLDSTLTEAQIIAIVKTHDNSKYYENEEYFKGDNPTILIEGSNKVTVQRPVDGKSSREPYKDSNSSQAPDNRIPIPYARKISLTTKNYMFLIPVEYQAKDSKYLAQLNEVFFINDNYKKTNQIGLDLIVHGAAYKLFYTKTINNIEYPAYTVIEGNEIIPIYNYDIEPQLICAIRYYPKTIDNTSERKYVVEVYYTGFKNVYESESIKLESMTLKIVEERTPYIYDQVPLVVYTDKYGLGVFDAVKKIIDGIDKIISMDMNEIEKFALAYLVLYGAKIKPENVDSIKEKRFFEDLPEKAKLEYLTKQIDGDFNGSVLDFLVDHVHKITSIPDFDSKTFAAESGVALLYKLIGFENVASDIEAIYISGEKQSIELINNVLYPDAGKWEKFKFWKKNTDKMVDVNMSRNLPEDMKNKVEIAERLKIIGVSMETILEFIPSSIIKDVAEEIKKLEEQSDKDFQKFKDMQNEGIDNDEENEDE